jgi:hypothetical protein
MEDRRKKIINKRETLNHLEREQINKNTIHLDKETKRDTNSILQTNFILFYLIIQPPYN